MTGDHLAPDAFAQFVARAIGAVSIGEPMPTSPPFPGACVAVLPPITYVPTFSLWLPSVFH